MSAPLLIDDAGRVWGRSSALLRQAVGGPAGDLPFADYVVMNLGYVEIRPFSSGAQVLLRADKVSPKAVATLLYWVLTCWRGRVVLSTFHPSGMPALVSDQDELVALLERYADNSAPVHDLFLSRPKPLRGTRLGHLVPDITEALQSASNVSALPLLCSRLIGDRYTLTRVPPSASHLVIAETGEGYRNVHPTWYKLARGLTFGDSPDYHYGRWVAEAHHRALALNTALLDDVDALVNWPRRGRVRTRYERLILPFHAPDGSRWVLSTSTMRDDIDLRARIGHEPRQVG